MQKRRGLILIELVIALSLLSALLLFSQHWLTQQNRNALAVNDLPVAQQMLKAIEYFWLQERRPPTSLNELISKGYIAAVWQPWPGEWRLQLSANMLRLALPATDLAVAQRTSEQVPGAHVNSTNELTLHVFEPVQLALHKRYLHRTVDVTAPEYNQMEVDLNMNGHALDNAGNVIAERVVTTSALIDQATFNQVQAASASVTDLLASNATLGSHDVVLLANRVQQLHEQWQLCLANGGCQ
ncbi:MULTISPECIES: hypothetical protein [Pseudidiomarina]|uniref:Uncharacterized protein n=1 Tax=Pseudidiomarina homiensis TaxID=364198 RepID=A0A432Y588_9GAMM|nr:MULTISPECIES: hypothetical protein [Pseudidiomarina]RUO56092.1 hypothetical protein CWI70_04845 [Pseudidiomarina homiensis]